MGFSQVPVGKADRLDVRKWLRQCLPAEHGSWAFVLEPLLIGWILGGAPAGIAGLGMFLAFLAYRPMEMGVRDVVRRKRYPRTMPSLALGSFLGVSGIALIVLANNWPLLAWLVLYGSLFSWLDAVLKPRSLLRELAGALLALPAILVWGPLSALVTAIVVVRPAVAILSVRGVIDRMGDAVACRWVGAAMGLGLLVLAWVAFGERRLLAGAYMIAGLRAVYLALTASQDRKAIRVGIAESVVALAVVLAWLSM